MSRRTPSPSVPQRGPVSAAGPRRPSRVLSEAGVRETAGDYRRPTAASRDSAPQPSDRDEMWEEKRRKFLEKRRGQSPSTEEVRSSSHGSVPLRIELEEAEEHTSGYDGYADTGYAAAAYDSPPAAAQILGSPIGYTSSVSPKNPYMSELELQVLEKKARQEREKREQDELEARKAREAAEYDYFSRRGGGGGAPMRDADGNIITSRKALVSTPTRPATNSSSFDARAEVSAYSARITTPASPPVSSGAKSEYLRALEEQIAEKNARKARERQDAERWERQKDSEAAQYDYFAKGSAGGGGTPLRTPDGRQQTNLRDASHGSSADSGRSRESLFGTPERADAYVAAPSSREALPSIRGPVPGGRAAGGPVRSDPVDRDLLDTLRSQNSSLKEDVASLEAKLARAVELLDKYYARYGPLSD